LRAKNDTEARMTPRAATVISERKPEKEHENFFSVTAKCRRALL